MSTASKQASVRVGVAGGGLIAQIAHLPSLAQLAGRFELAALADPSQTVREALGARYGVRAHADWRAMLSQETLDAIVVCSPNGTHVDIVLAALENGLHVLVEKPLCLSLQDVERICERRAESGRVVQIGYHKRYDAGYESLLSALPENGEDLRLVDVLTYDPWMGRPPFAPADLVVGRDVPEQERRAVAEREREQVQAAVGASDPVSVRVYSDLYAGAFVHDVNLVNGVLGHLGVELPARTVSAGHWTDGKAAGYWAAGKAANIAFRLPGGIGWQNAWVMLEGLEEYCQTASFAFGDQIHRLRFSSPYLRQLPTVHEITGAAAGAARQSRSARIKDAYLAQLEHFHSCIVDGAECRTPPEQARLDLQTLQQAFLVDMAEGATG
jgi:predicted dehydrogenase